MVMYIEEQNTSSYFGLINIGKEYTNERRRCASDTCRAIADIDKIIRLY